MTAWTKSKLIETNFSFLLYENKGCLFLFQKHLWFICFGQCIEMFWFVLSFSVMLRTLFITINQCSPIHHPNQDLQLQQVPSKFIWQYRKYVAADKNRIDQHDFHAGSCWHMLVSAGLAGGPAWWSWSTSKVLLIMMAYQHSLAGDIADESGHQHGMFWTSIQSPATHAGSGMPVTIIQLPASHAPAWKVPCPCWQGTPVPESYSISSLFWVPSNEPKILQVWSLYSINLMYWLTDWLTDWLCVLDFQTKFTPPLTLCNMK